MLSRITLCAFLTATLCAPFVSSSASIQDPIFERIKLDHQQIEKAAHRRGVETAWLEISSVEPQSIDVEHYTLQLQLTPTESGTAGIISGTVTISGKTVGPVSSISIDAQPNLNIDSVLFNGNQNNFRRNNAR